MDRREKARRAAGGPCKADRLAVATTESAPPGEDPSCGRWRLEHELEWHRAETERLQVLVDFLGRPIHAPGGSEPDPDIITAYNLAVEAALNGIRRAASGRNPNAV